MGQLPLLAVLVLMVNEFVAPTVASSGLDDNFETAALPCVEMAKLLSSASVVSVVALGVNPDVLPVLVLGGGVVPPVVPVVPVVPPVVPPVVLVALGQLTLVVEVVQPVDKLERLSSVLLTQPDSAVETASIPKPNKIRI